MLAGRVGAASAPQGQMDDWSMQRWSTANGLPQNSVTSVLQDSSGMLCLTTFGGLVRFDGLSMEVTAVADDARLCTNRLLGAMVCADGSLLVGTEDHGVLHIEGNRVRRVLGCPEAETLTVVDFAAGIDGEVWLATHHGLARCRGGAIDWPWPKTRTLMNSVARAADGTIWVAATNGAWIFGRGEPRLINGAALNSVTISGDGTILMGGPDGVVRVTDSGLVPFCDTAVSRPDGLQVAANRDLLIAGDARFERWQVSPSRRLQTSDLPAPGRSVLEDRDGRIWIGTDGAGLLCLRRSDLRRTHVGRSTLLASDDRGGWYRVSGIELLHTAASGEQRVLLSTEVEIDALEHTPRGDLLLGVGDEVRRLDQDGKVTTVCSIDRAVHGRIAAVSSTANDTIWFGTAFGTVGRWHNGELRCWQPAGLEPGAVHCFLETTDGLWVGTTHGVLRTTDDGDHWQPLAAGDEIAPGEVRGLAADDRGGVWIGSYGGGLSYWQSGRIHRVGRRHGLPSHDICQLEIDRNRGEMLANTNAGLTRCLLADLEALVTGRSPAVAWQVLVHPDGIAAEGNGFMWPSSCRLADGTWLFCCLDDVVSLPPDHVTVPDKPLVARVERLPVAENADRRLVRFRFTAPAFENASFVTFRHRLRGHDADWVLDGHARTVEYFDLPGGDHVFEVAAAGPGTAWGPTASIAFRVPPHWHELPISWLAILAGVTTLTLVIFRLASFRQAHKNRLLRAAVQDRTEDLEREIHRRREAENRLQVAHDELERHVASRTEELRTALQQLENDAKVRGDLQRQVDQLQRLESIGRLAGGIAHDFNNLLTVVRSSTELIRVAPNNPDNDDLLASIERAAMQGTRLTQQLLTFARRQAVRPEVFDLRDLVRNSALMLRRLVSANITLSTSLPDQPAVIEADRAQIEQVLVNLCVNARDAMPDGGRLDIILSSGEGLGGRPTCQLRVTDTGIGMTPEIVEHACEPFFSTKNRSTNSGLGLATCYGIVKRLDGDLRIDSAPGKGTSIAITLPCTDKALPPVSGDFEIPRPRHLHGTVLVVEDHPEVRDALARLLEQLGCRVETAGDGTAALRLLEQRSTFDFVVSDVAMPGIHGVELANAMQKLRPNLPIVFVSGNPEPEGEYGLLAAAGYEMVQKPPEPALLIAAIQRARQAAGARASTDIRPVSGS